MRFAVLQRDGFRCRYCGASGDSRSLHVDHITPVAAGGENEFENLATACQSCNAGKSDAPLLVGLFFHILTESGDIGWQGRILRASDTEVSVVYYDWFVGEESTSAVFPRAAVGQWRLYPSDTQMRRAYEQHQISSRLGGAA